MTWWGVCLHPKIQTFLQEVTVNDLKSDDLKCSDFERTPQQQIETRRDAKGVHSNSTLQFRSILNP